MSWRSPLRISVVSEWRGVIETFSADLAMSIGWDVDIVDAATSPDVIVRRVRDCGDEEYRLSIDAQVSIDASTAAGLAYALTTLRQLAPDELWSTGASIDVFELPRLFIEDGPRFSWRGVHLDVARHFFDVATVCRMIDLVALHRLNRLHLHLNDDQGWRVEVPNWPRLKDVASIRRSSPIGHEGDALDDDVSHGGCYSADDLEVDPPARTTTIRHHRPGDRPTRSRAGGARRLSRPG